MDIVAVDKLRYADEVVIALLTAGTLCCAELAQKHIFIIRERQLSAVDALGKPVDIREICFETG